jgi:clan AA aspartic protease (TIGR02281 family)
MRIHIQFLICAILGGFTMSHYELGKAVFIVAAVILVKPAVAQSPATSQTVMTFAVENRAIRLSAMANGVPVRFLVDTGATMVAFPRAAAGKLGLSLKSSSRNATASTAAGTKYPVTFFRLKRLEIGSCVLSEVEALLVGGPMPEPLLGMSALLRMNVEMSDGKISLRCPDAARPTVAPSSVAKPRELTRRH